MAATSPRLKNLLCPDFGEALERDGFHDDIPADEFSALTINA
jgi:hypothetical protein